MASKSVVSIVERQTNLSRQRFALTAVHCIGFFILLAVGLLGLTAEQGRDSLHALELRRLFALLMSATLLARTLWALKQLGQKQPAAIHRFHACSARMIYLLLYCLIGFQIISGLHGAGQVNTEHCQFYVECAVISLAAFRALIWRPVHFAVA